MYVHEQIEHLYQYYLDIIQDNSIKTVHDQLLRFAQKLLVAYQNHNPLAVLEISNYHPNYIGIQSLEEIDRRLNIEDIQYTIARAYHFEDWDEVARSEAELNRSFEAAVDDVIFGRKQPLKTKMTADPNLLQRRSQYGHHAGLIHYVSANGIEIWRQRVPHNILEIAKMLLDAGADPYLYSDLYGGTMGVLGLVETSAHPFNAGISDQLIKLLKTYL